VFAGRAIARHQNLFELGADSLMLVKIHQDIEARFPGKVEITDLFDYPTIAALAAYLARG
jgi:acyl carrier protein